MYTVIRHHVRSGKKTFKVCIIRIIRGLIFVGITLDVIRDPQSVHVKRVQNIHGVVTFGISGADIYLNQTSAAHQIFMGQWTTCFERYPRKWDFSSSAPKLPRAFQGLLKTPDNKNMLTCWEYIRLLTVSHFLGIPQGSYQISDEGGVGTSHKNLDKQGACG